MDQLILTAVFCVTLAFLSGATCVTLLLGGGYQPIYFYDTETQENKTINSDTWLRSLDYHYSKGYIYYTGYSVIRRSIDPNIKELKVIEKDQFVSGIAVDWLNDNIYWARSGNVEVVKANLDGNNKISIITKSVLDQVKGQSENLYLHDIKVDPYERLLFMIAATSKLVITGTLVKSDLQGRNLTVITHRKYKKINTFAIERLQKMLYVVKAGHQGIYSCNYDGMVVEKFSVCSNIGSIHSFATFRQNMYMSSFGGPESTRHFHVEPLASMKCSTGPSKADKIPNFDSISDIKVYHVDVQRPLNVYNTYQRIRQRFSNWDKCSLLPTEWERVDCLEMVPLKTVNNKSVELLIGISNGIIQWYDTETQETKVIANDSIVLSLDYHYSKGYIYYSGDSIKRRSIDSNIQDLKIIAADRYVFGIAVDWIHNNIYWTRSHDVELVKADLDGNNQTSIITKSIQDQVEGLCNIIFLYCIEVDPYERTLFMIAGSDRNWIIGTLVKSDLEGRNISLLTDRKYKTISTFTIDRAQKILYIVNSGHQGIYSCKYNGEVIEEFSVCPKITWINPFAVFRKNMYMAYSVDGEKKNIFHGGVLASVKCPLDSLKSDNTILGIKVYAVDVQQPLDVYNSYQPIKQRFSNWNKCSLLSTEWERIYCLEKWHR